MTLLYCLFAILCDLQQTLEILAEAQSPRDPSSYVHKDHNRMSDICDSRMKPGQKTRDPSILDQDLGAMLS